MSYPLRLSSIEQAPVDDGLCVYNHKSNALCLLNPSAAYYWAARLRGDTPESFAQMMSRETGIDEGKVLHEVSELEHNWHAAGLLVSERLAEPEFGRRRPEHQFATDANAALDQVYRADNGATLRICIDEPCLANLVSGALRPFRNIGNCETGTDGALHIWSSTNKADPSQSDFTIARDGQVVLAEVDRETARRVVLRNVLFSSWPAKQVGAMLHAASVSWNGNAVILSGPGGSGKSTLAAGLLARGWRYGSDDMTPIMRDGFQCGRFPTAMSIKQDAWAALERDIPELAQLRSVEAQGSTVKYLSMPQSTVGPRLSLVKTIVFPVHTADAPSVTMQELQASQTLGRLIETGSGPDGRPNSIHPLVKLVGTVPAYEMRYANLDQVNELLQGIAA